MLRFPRRRAPWLTARYWFFNTLSAAGIFQSGVGPPRTKSPADSGERVTTGRKIARTICGVVVFGVLLLCQVHAAVQLITGGPLDSGDWIGIASFGLIVLMAVSHLKRVRKVD